MIFFFLIWKYTTTSCIPVVRYGLSGKKNWMAIFKVKFFFYLWIIKQIVLRPSEFFVQKDLFLVIVYESSFFYETTVILLGKQPFLPTTTPGILIYLVARQLICLAVDYY